MEKIKKLLFNAIKEDIERDLIKINPKSLKKYYKLDINLKLLIKRIHNLGYDTLKKNTPLYDSVDIQYKNIIRSIVNDILDDEIAHKADNIKEKLDICECCGNEFKDIGLYCDECVEMYEKIEIDENHVPSK